MTEGYEDGGSLVLVQAQVMMRDDNMGGWLPMGGWGLSKVSVRKRHPRYEHVNAEHPKTEYMIFGKRINDGVSVLSCTIKKDFVYHKVLPTFHHWKTGDKKFGLTFQTAADARAFDSGVRLAVKDLLDGLPDYDTSPLYESPPPPPLPPYGRPLPPPPRSPPPLPPDLGDNDVFMTLDLPVDRYSESSSDSAASRQTAASPLHHQMTFPAPAAALTSGGRGHGSADSATENPYVQFAHHPPHVYSYVGMKEPLKPSDPVRRGPCETLHMTQPPLPPAKAAVGEKRPQACRPLPRRCRHCQEPYDEATNARGQCEYAPDALRTCLDTVTCIPAAQCMLYHCCADAEGDYEARPCSCTPQQERWPRRWLALALLAALLPCLCCYPPLTACYACCRRCHLCGGKHGASPHP